MPDKSRALAEALRILKPGGRLAFTDWVAHRVLSEADKALLWQGMAVTTQFSPQAYGELIEGAGFKLTAVDNLTADWAVILKERLTMFRKLRGEAQQANTPAGHDAFYDSYVLFVESGECRSSRRCALCRDQAKLARPNERDQWRWQFALRLAMK